VLGTERQSLAQTTR